MRKPFGTAELLARIQAVLRRNARRTGGDGDALSVGPLILDPQRYTAEVAGNRLHLTPTEYRLVTHLASHAGRVVTYDQLLRFVWGIGYEQEYHLLQVSMSRLRHKLSELDAQDMIRTVSGVGYELVREPPPRGDGQAVTHA